MDANFTGNRIAECRKNQKLTQKELGVRLGVSDAAVSKWERGLNFPDIALLEPLAETLGTTPAELLGLKEATTDKTIREMASLSAAENQEIKKGIRLRSLMTVVCSVILMAAEIYSSFIASKAGLQGGLFGFCTIGMLPVMGNILGFALYSFAGSKKF